MSALTRTLSALGGRTARRTAILATAPLLAASGVALMPAQAAPTTMYGLEAFTGTVADLPDTAANCGTTPCKTDNTNMGTAVFPANTVAGFTIIGTLQADSTATAIHVNAGSANPDVWLYTAKGGSRIRLDKGTRVVKVIAARPVTDSTGARVASAPLVIEKVRELALSKASKASVAHDFLSVTTAGTWTLGTAPNLITLDMSAAAIDPDVISAVPTIVQYTDVAPTA